MEAVALLLPDVEKIYSGAGEVSKIYFGSELVWSSWDGITRLTCLSMPTITPDTSVIAEPPVSDGEELTCLSMPSITPGTVVAYKVTYNGNENDGGSVPTDSTYYSSGTGVTVLGNTGTLTKEGYDFDGWNTQADGGGTSYAPDDSFNITGTTTLYAQWTNDLEKVLKDQVFDKYKTTLDDDLLKEVFGG